jgi:FkbM family methyltransferase
MSFGMALKGLRSDFRIVREGSDLGVAACYSVAKALGLATPVEVTISGIRVTVRPNSPDLVVAKKSITGEFDDVIRAVRPLEHNFIIDAGGYIGTVAVVLARTFPSATIVTIEPSKQNYEILRKNTKGYTKIIALNAALGPAEGRAPFFDHGDGQWGYSLLSRNASGASAKALHEVNVVTIPGIMQRFSAPGVDLLKLDIEGGERNLLSGAPTWVSSVRVIAAELHDWVVDGCEKTFRTATEGRRELDKSGELVISVAAR